MAMVGAKEVTGHKAVKRSADPEKFEELARKAVPMIGGPRSGRPYVELSNGPAVIEQLDLVKYETPECMYLHELLDERGLGNRTMIYVRSNFKDDRPGDTLNCSYDCLYLSPEQDSRDEFIDILEREEMKADEAERR